MQPPKYAEKRGGVRPGAGRKPNPFKEPNLKAKSQTLHLPELPGGRNAKPAVLVKWWTELTPEQLEHLAVYVYRKWPVWDAKRFDPKAQTNIRMYTGPCPFSLDHWERDILTEFGSGDYSFSINDDAINRWGIMFKGMRDFDNYPPLVDIRLVMLDDPANKSYVDWLRVRGRLDGIDLKENGDNMANNEALNRSLDMNERLTDRVIDLSAVAAGKPAEIDTRARAEMRGMELVQEGAKETISFMRETMSEITKSQTQNADPLQMVDRIISLTQGLNKGDGRADELAKQMLEMERRRGDDLREEMKELRAEMRNVRENGGSGGGFGGIIAQLKDVGGIKDILTDLGLIKGSVTEQSEEKSTTPNSFKAMIFNSLLQQAPQLIGAGGLNGLASTLMNGLAFMNRPAGAPGQPAPQQPQSQQPAVEAAPAAPPPNINGFPMPSPTGNATVDPLLQYVWRITPALLHHMGTESLNGYTFARWMIDSDASGRQNYNMAKEAGSESFSQLLEMYPPVWSILVKTPVTLKTFMEEFLTLDAWEMDQAGEDEEEQEGMPGPVVMATSASAVKANGTVNTAAFLKK